MYDRKNMPHWKAPDTLLCRVMHAVEKKQCLCGYFAWPVINKILFGCGALAALGIVIIVTAKLSHTADILVFVNESGNYLIALYDKVLIVHHVLSELITQYLLQPAVAGFAVVIGVAIFTAWIGSVMVLYRVLRMPVRRKFI